MTATKPAGPWLLDLGYTKPPISANSRMHWRQRATITKQIRSRTEALAREEMIPPLGRCRVELRYRPRDNRRRDADNLVPILKAACDGLVDAGIVPDDIPAFMAKRMPVIDEADRHQPGLFLAIARWLPDSTHEAPTQGEPA